MRASKDALKAPQFAGIKLEKSYKSSIPDACIGSRWTYNTPPRSRGIEDGPERSTRKTRKIGSAVQTQYSSSTRCGILQRGASCAEMVRPLLFKNLETCNRCGYLFGGYSKISSKDVARRQANTFGKKHLLANAESRQVTFNLLSDTQQTHGNFALLGLDIR